MSDLVQRLRDFSTEDDERFCIKHDICDEAADEIERLAALAASNFSAAVDAQERVEAAVAAERERCAKLCEEVEDQAWALWKAIADPIEQGRNIGAQHCADAIRQSVDNLPTE